MSRKRQPRTDAPGRHVGASMPTGAKLSERGLGNLFWIANAGRHRDLNDFFGDDVRDPVIAINKIERLQCKRVRLVQPLDLVRPQQVLRKKAIDRYNVPPTAASEAYANFVTKIHFGGAFLCRELWCVRRLNRC